MLRAHLLRKAETLLVRNADIYVTARASSAREAGIALIADLWHIRGDKEALCH